MKPGEIITKPNSDIILNEDRDSITVKVANTGDRPIQEKSYGMRLDIPSGSAVRFEPGQTKDVELIPVVGNRKIYGFNTKVMGEL